MFVATLALLLSLAPQFGLAQIERAASTTTSSAAAATHSINVGADGLKFTPDSVTAAVGDIILFRFYPQNHSVARADYESPCIPYELTGAGRVGFWSGFQPINVVLSDPPTFQVLVNDTAPIFFYCSAPGACIENQMVGVINPNSTETLATQIAYAENATLALSPGEGFPVETLSPTSATQSPTSTPTSTATAKAAPTAAAAPSSQPPLSAGAIAGIAIGGTAVLLFGSALIYFCGRQRTVNEIMQTQGPRGPPSYQPGTGHMSLASSAGYPPKFPPVGSDPLRASHYSNQGGVYDRSAAETESYRSRSPPMDENRDSMRPHMNYPGPTGTTSPARVDSPLMRKPVPGSPVSFGSPGRPIRSSQSNPISPLEEGMYQPLAADIPSPLRFNQVTAQQMGPHELSVDSDRAHLPYQHREPGQGGYGLGPG